MCIVIYGQYGIINNLKFIFDIGNTVLFFVNKYSFNTI